MKRLWIGVVLLAVLLAAALVLLLVSQSFYREFSANLEQASKFALAEDWEDATKCAEKSRDLWLRYRRFLAAFTDHEPIEQVQELFSRLEICQTQRWKVDFANVCQSLSNLAEAIDESHNLKWWSIL